MNFLPFSHWDIVLASAARNAHNQCMQYIIRNVPDSLDQALRRTASEQGRSLNEVAIEAMARGAGVTGERNPQRDLADIAGTWRNDPAFDSALAAQDALPQLPRVGNRWNLSSEYQVDSRKQQFQF